jgi:hypothetical protein
MAATAPETVDPAVARETLDRLQSVVAGEELRFRADSARRALLVSYARHLQAMPDDAVLEIVRRVRQRERAEADARWPKRRNGKPAVQGENPPGNGPEIGSQAP